MKIRILILLPFLFISGILISNRPSTAYFANAQTSSSTTLVDDFANGSNPPRLNQFNFNHSFTLGTAWDLTGSTIGEPLSQSPPYALTLYAGNEDRITFNLPSASSYATSAQVWGWTLPAQNGIRAGRGRVVFEGTGDTKTFSFSGGALQWQVFKANENDAGDNGNPLGAIVAVRLADIGNNGDRVMFDDLEVATITPPRRSNLTLAMAASTNTVNVGQTITYDLTVTNTGPESAPNVTIQDVLPHGGTFVAGGSSNACRLVRGLVECNLGSLAVNSSRTVTIAVQVGQDACASFTNQATVTAQALDNNMADNTAVSTATTPLPACADFTTTLTASPVPIDAGDDLTYLLTIKNNGPDTAGGTAALTLPPDITGQQITADSGVTCSGASSPVSCSVPALAAGEQKQIVLTASASTSATGIQLATASATPAIPDPLPENNSTRFRFVMGLPFDFSIIAELDMGVLSGFDTIWSIDINNQGDVAFYVVDFVNPPYEFRVYEGDGTTLTQKFASTDLPALNNGLVHYPTFACADLSDAGALALVSEIRDPALGSSLNAETKVGSMVHLIEPNGTLTTLDSQQLSVDGNAYRAYDQPVIDSAGRVVVNYEIPKMVQPEGLMRFENGSGSTIYEATATDIELLDLGSSPGGLAWKEAQGWLFPTYRLLFAQETGNGLFLSDRLQQPTRPFTNGMIGVTEFGATAYAQTETDPLTGIAIESFYLGGSQPVMRGITTSTTDPFSFRDSVVNENLRYAVKSRGFNSYYGKLGIFVGPDRVGHRVLRSESGKGDFLFGSRAVYLMGQGGTCSLALNDVGQLAFGVGLEDGRILIVRADPTRDNDGDGIPDWDELGAPNHGDGNEDGIVDSVQPHVASVPNGVDGTAVTFTADPNSTLTNAQSVPNPSPSDAPNASFPFGHFAFELTDVPPGGSTSVTLTLPWAAVQSWWKYGRTPGNPTPHWYEFTFDGTTGADINGNVVTLHFVDGARGDDDLMANGVIVDPGGPSAYPFAVYLPMTIKD